MLSVKEVSDLSGISVRMLHYYDEIDLFKPSNKNSAGYRLYNEQDLETLKQILYFKELDIPLKEIKKIINSPFFDKMKALENQKKLLVLKRDRLNNLIESLDKTLKGENNMSFKEFDMSEYYKVLEDYKNNNEEAVIKTFGSIEKYDEMIKGIKENEETIAENAVKVYGSVAKCAEAMKNDMANERLKNINKGYEKFRDDFLKGRNVKINELFKRIVSSKDKDPYSLNLQEVAGRVTRTVKEDYEYFAHKKGDDYWYHFVKNLENDARISEALDKQYGEGTTHFIYMVLINSLKDKKPKLDMLYEKLASMVNKDPSCEEVQEIVEKIAETTRANNEYMKGKTNINYKGFLANLGDVYIKNAETKDNPVDKKYGEGAAYFIGRALKIYGEL